MLTRFSTLSMVLVTSTLAVATGCGQDDFLDLSEVDVAVEEGKNDVYVPGSGYTWVRPSTTQISCIRAPCPNAIIDNVNQGSSQLSYGYDWRALKLSAADQTRLEANAGKMLLYGRYATARKSGEMVQIYQVTRANPRVVELSVDRPDSDRYYMVKATTPSCTQPPCGYSALLMNQPAKEQWSDLDLSRLGLPQNARQRLVSELQSGSAYVSIRNASEMPVVVTEAFRPYNAAPLSNN